VIENKFQLPTLQQPTFFGHQACSDQKFLVVKLVVMESFWSPIV